VRARRRSSYTSLNAPVWYGFYNVLVSTAFLISLPFVPLIACLGSRYRDGLWQRLGFYPSDFPGLLARDRPVWIHAASVGEVRSAEPLIGAFRARAPKRKIVLSTFTATGNRVAKQMVGVDAVIFLPLDFFWIVRRALSRFNPALLVIIETEIWPNLLRQAFRRGTPVLLLSGRLSAKALARYTLCQKFFRRVLRCFTALGMQSSEDAARIVTLGADARKVSVVGNLKLAAPSRNDNRDGIAAHARGEKLWLVAGSSHDGEEAILLEALSLARRQFPKLSLILAPRHPERFAEVARLLRGSGFTLQLKSATDSAEWFSKDVLLLDTVGELADFYALADIAFVGGSLVPVGGHNVLEPARFGKAILFGPHMNNFAELAETMKRQGAALEVRGAMDIAGALTGLLADAEKRHAMGRAAAEIAGADQHALTLNWRLAERYL
jgi:3-deoxy-D-manno-octulosonic-acid transferase